MNIMNSSNLYNNTITWQSDSEDVERMSKELSEIVNLFTGHTAWFSTSVLPKTRGLWLALGGTECSLETADFVFSRDVKTPDTASIFTDDSYRKYGLAVIHPTYIKACIVAEDIMDVVLGDYILYPENLQEFIEEQQANSICPAKTQQNCSATENQTRNKSLHYDQKTEAKRKADTETTQSQEREEDAVHISDMELISGELEDFIPGENKCQVYHL